MALTVTHSFVSPVVDDSVPGEVGPGEWNATHTVTGTQDASAVSFAPVGGIAATDVQAAIAELDTEKATITYVNAGDAARIPIAGNYAWKYDADTWHLNDEGRNITVGNVIATGVFAGASSFTGHVALPANPASNQAVRKDYADNIYNTLVSADTLKVAKAGDTMSGKLYVTHNTGVGVAGGSSAGQIETNNPLGGFAGITIHSAGAFAFNLGMEPGISYDLRVGGWSMGAGSWRVVHEGLTSVKLPGPLAVGGSGNNAGILYVNKGTYGWPSPSPVGDPAVNTRIDSGNVAIDFGSNASVPVTSYATWIQSRNAGDYNNCYPLYLQPLGAGVQIGSGSPYIAPKLHISNGNVYGDAVGSGTYDGGVAQRMVWGSGALDFGLTVNSTTGCWIQSREISNLAAQYALKLNPNGGPVGINTAAAVWGALTIHLPGTTNNFVFQSIDGYSVLGVMVDSGAAWNDLSIHSYNSLKPRYDNTIQVGNGTNRWTSIWAVAGAIQTSDARAKKDVQDSDLGLDFINTLRPVSYKWIVGKNVVTREPDPDAEPPPSMPEAEPREAQIIYKDVVTPVPGKRTHYGLIAQEVAASVQAAGVVDFGGYINPMIDADPKSDDVTPDTELGLRYDEFIAPMIKAIQELSARVVALEAQLAALT